MKHQVQSIKEQLEIWKDTIIKNPYHDSWSTVQMGQLIAMIVGYISQVEDKIDNLNKQEQ